MDIEELKTTEKTPEELEEQQKKMEEIYVSMFKTWYKDYLRKIQEYIDFHKITIEQAVDEALEKKSGLSSMCRNILLGVKIEHLKNWFPKNPRIQYDEDRS